VLRRSVTGITCIALLLAAVAAARPGMYEYFKAGTKRSRTSATLPHGRGRAGATDAATLAHSTPSVAPWTEAWFADSSLVRRRVAETAEALAVPMIGQAFPLPRGGGFVCTRVDGGGEAASGDLSCVIECAGPALGGRRRNWFFASDADPTPTLDRVRWVITAPAPGGREPWRAFVLEVADSVSRVLGPPDWSDSEHTAATWTAAGRTTLLRLYGDPTHVDSLEMECVSDRLTKRADAAPRP
jgi:hypothetical protein